MTEDSPELQEKPDPLKPQRDSGADLPPNLPELDPAAGAEEDEEARLPDIVDAGAEAVAEGPLAVGRAAIERAVRLPPPPPPRLPVLETSGGRPLFGQGQKGGQRPPPPSPPPRPPARPPPEVAGPPA